MVVQSKYQGLFVSIISARHRDSITKDTDLFTAIWMQYLANPKLPFFSRSNPVLTVYLAKTVTS
jgi:hypothetical protein